MLILLLLERCSSVKCHMQTFEDDLLVDTAKPFFVRHPPL